MKKTLIRIISLVLVFSTVFCLSSCGKTEDDTVNYLTMLDYSFGKDINTITLDELWESLESEATELNAKDKHTTSSGNSFSVKAIRDKKTMFPIAWIGTLIINIFSLFTGLVSYPAYYDATKGNRFFDVKIKYTNNSDNDITVDQVLNSAIVKIGDEYRTVSVINEKTSKFDYYCTDDVIKSGKSTTVHLYIILPKETFKEDIDLEMIFSIDEEIYHCDYEK